MYHTHSSEVDRHAPAVGKYTSVVDRYTPGVVTYSSRVDRVTPPEMDVSSCCRNFLLSRLKAAEVLNKQLSDEASSSNRLRTLRPPGEFNVDLAIEQLRAQLVTLLEGDINIIRQLLVVNEQIEEVKWQRKYADGSPRTTSIYMSGSYAADTEDIDLESYMDFLASTKHPLMQSSAFADDLQFLYPGLRVGQNEDGGGTDDVTDEVFQNDDFAKPKNNARVSNEIRFTVKQNEPKVTNNPPSQVKRPAVEFKVKGQKAADINKTTKVEFRVNSAKTVENAKLSSRGGDGKIRGPGDAKSKHETAKIEFRVDNAKAMASSPFEIRLVLPHSTNPQAIPDRFRGTSGTPCQTGLDDRPRNVKSSHEMQELGSNALHCNQHTGDLNTTDCAVVSHL